MSAPWYRVGFVALQSRPFRTLWFGTLLASVTMQMAGTARAVVAFDLAGNNSAVGLVALGSGFAFLIATPVGGVVADRIPKLRVLLLGQTCFGLIILTVGLLILTDRITVSLLVASAFATGIASSFFAPARHAFVAELAPRHLLANAFALSQLAFAVGRVGGPFLAGALIGIGAIGAGGTYMVMTGLFVLVMATMLRLPMIAPAPRSATESVREAILSGLRHIRERPRLRVLTLSFVAVVILAYPVQHLLPGLLVNELNRSTHDIGLMLGVGAVGGLGVSVVLAGLAGGRHATLLMVGTGAVLALGLVAVAAAPSFGLALPGMLLVGGGQAGFRIMNNALLLPETEPAFYGRVLSVTILGFGIENLAAAPMGVLADAIGERPVLALLGAGTLGVLALTWVSLAATRREAAGDPPRVEEAGPERP